MQRSMATIVTSRMKSPPKKLEFSQVCLGFGFSALIPKKLVLIKKLDLEILSDNVFQLEIRDSETRLKSLHICSVFSPLVVEITGNHYNGRFIITSLITVDQH